MTTSERLRQQVIEAFQEIFPDDTIELDSDFFELGGDSIALANLTTSLEAKIGTEIHPSSLLYHPTVVEFAEALAALLQPDSDLKASN